MEKEIAKGIVILTKFMRMDFRDVLSLPSADFFLYLSALNEIYEDGEELDEDEFETLFKPLPRR